MFVKYEPQRMVRCRKTEAAYKKGMILKKLCQC